MSIRIGYFDLETSSLSANFGVILCGVVADDHGHEVVFRADDLNRKWATHRGDDAAVTEAITAELCKYDILVAHNGANFDIPYLRTRLARWNLPSFPTKKLIDPYRLARNKLRMSSNSLDALTDFLGFNTKTRVSGRVWTAAYLDGDRAAMDEIVAHCRADVEMLTRLLDAIKDYSLAVNPRGSDW